MDLRWYTVCENVVRSMDGSLSQSFLFSSFLLKPRSISQWMSFSSAPLLLGCAVQGFSCPELTGSQSNLHPIERITCHIYMYIQLYWQNDVDGPSLHYILINQWY